MYTQKKIFVKKDVQQSLSPFWYRLKDEGEGFLV